VAISNSFSPYSTAKRPKKNDIFKTLRLHMPALPNTTTLQDMVALVERLRAWTQVNLFTYIYMCVCLCSTSMARSISMAICLLTVFIYSCILPVMAL